MSMYKFVDKKLKVNGMKRLLFFLLLLGSLSTPSLEAIRGHHGGHRGGHRGVRGAHRVAHRAHWHGRHMAWRAGHPRHFGHRRIWWGNRWWGPGWSSYPWRWNFGFYTSWGFPNLVETGQWASIVSRLHQEIDRLQDEAAGLRMRLRSATEENKMKYQGKIETLEKRINQLEDDIEQADVYQKSPRTE